MVSLLGTVHFEIHPLRGNKACWRHFTPSKVLHSWGTWNGRIWRWACWFKDVAITSKIAHRSPNRKVRLWLSFQEFFFLSFERRSATRACVNQTKKPSSRERCNIANHDRQQVSQEKDHENNASFSYTLTNQDEVGKGIGSAFAAIAAPPATASLPDHAVNATVEPAVSVGWSNRVKQQPDQPGNKIIRMQWVHQWPGASTCCSVFAWSV